PFDLSFGLSNVLLDTRFHVGITLNPAGLWLENGERLFLHGVCAFETSGKDRKGLITFEHNGSPGELTGEATARSKVVLLFLAIGNLGYRNSGPTHFSELGNEPRL